MRFIVLFSPLKGINSLKRRFNIMGIILIFLLLVLVVSTMNKSTPNGDKDDDTKDFLGYMDEINRKK